MRSETGIKWGLRAVTVPDRFNVEPTVVTLPCLLVFVCDGVVVLVALLVMIPNVVSLAGKDAKIV